MRLLLGEPGAAQVEAILEGEEEVFLPFMTIMELRYVLLRRFPAGRVLDIIETLRATRAEIVESNVAWGITAAEVKAGGGLSLADAWNAALALWHDAKLVHKDPEFDRVKGLKALRLR
jgi:predicted nucleic acid-binding protein